MSYFHSYCCPDNFLHIQWYGSLGRERTGVLSGILLNGRKIMLLHRFYLDLALARVISFLELWHFYLQTCRGEGQTPRLDVLWYSVFCVVVCAYDDSGLMAVIIGIHRVYSCSLGLLQETLTELHMITLVSISLCTTVRKTLVLGLVFSLLLFFEQLLLYQNSKADWKCCILKIE